LVYSNYTPFKFEQKQHNETDVKFANEIVSTILSKHKLLEKYTGKRRKILFVSKRNINLLIAHILNSDFDLNFMPYRPQPTLTPNVATATTPSPQQTTVGIPTTTPLTTTAPPIVIDRSDINFINNCIIALGIIKDNYEQIFADIFVDFILFPELVSADEQEQVRLGGSIFKGMIEDALAEFEQKYVYVSQGITAEDVPDILTKEFKIPEEIKNIEYRLVEKLNRAANEEENKKKHFRKFDVKKIPLNFSKVTLDIMEDFIKLYSKEHFDTGEQNELNNAWNAWKYYSANTFMILTDNGRMFYVGAFFFVISILVYFSDLF
jgi:hypothetical protein